MRNTVTFAAVALVSFCLSCFFWIPSPQADEFVSLTLYKPFVYRQLVPMLARAIMGLGVPANWAIVIIMTISGVGFFYALRALTRHFYPDTNDLYIFTLFVCGSLLFRDRSLPYDWMTACLFSLALLFLAQDKLLAYCLLFPVVCLNRETAFLLIIFYLFYDHDIRIGRDVAIMLYQVLVWFGVRLSLMYIFRNNGGSDAWFMPLHNFQVFFSNPLHSLLHIIIAGVILFWVFKDWYSKPYNLRLAFSIFAPLLLVMYWVFGQPFEVRVMWEVYPVIVLLMLPSLETSKQMVVLRNGGMPNETTA